MPEFFQSSQGIALGIAIIIFLIAAFLAIWRIVGFIFTLVLLVLAVVISFIIVSPHYFSNKTGEDKPLLKTEESADFKAQILHAIDEINAELSQEKESIKKVTDSVHLLVSQVESHKEKLQSFIEETRERLSKIKSDPEENKESEKLNVES